MSTSASSRPCDGPPPDATIVSVGPTVEWESNGSIAPISPGRATARRTAEALRTLEPDVVHLHEPIVPGPTVSALIGFNGPMVGTFHAAGEVPYQWLRPALRSLMMRLTYRVAVSESARETAEGNWTGAEYTVLVERGRDRAHRQCGPCADGEADGAVHRAARTAQRARRPARRVVRDRPRRAASSRRRRPADRRVEAPSARRRRRVVRHRHRRTAERVAAGCHGVLRAVATRRVVRSGAPRGDGRRRADRGVGDRGLPQRGPSRAATRCWFRPAMSARCATRCARFSTTRRCGHG